MKSNIKILEENIKSFTDIPQFLLRPEEQTKILDNLGIIFNRIFHKLDQDKTLNTKVGNLVGQINKILQTKPFNEGEFSSLVNELLSEINPTNENRLYISLKGSNDKLSQRALPFWNSEDNVIVSRERLSPEEIKKHDFDVLINDAQIYGLDYFLMIYKLLDTDKNIDSIKKIIYDGHEKLPSLISDALDDDMLKKITYHLISKDLRTQMIKSYYDYKKIFLSINNDKALATESEMEQVIIGLKNYVLSLIDVSTKMGIESIQNAIYSPYGKNIKFAELRGLLLQQ